MLPAAVFVVWRAIDEGRFLLYLPIGLAGITLGVWLNTQRSDGLMLIPRVSERRSDVPIARG